MLRYRSVHHTRGIECRKDNNVVDEIMANQVDLVDVVYTLRQVACIKG